jgi:hypothetical protein
MMNGNRNMTELMMMNSDESEFDLIIPMKMAPWSMRRSERSAGFLQEYSLT